MVEGCIDHVASLEEIADDKLSLEVIVHRIVAALAQFAYELLHLLIALLSHRHTLQVVQTIHQALQSLLASLQGIVREIYGAAVVGREDEEADGHWRISLLQTVVIASEELLQSDEVAKTLTHLLTVDGNHIVVHPVTNHLVALRSHSLSNLALVVRENQIHAATVNIEVAAQVLASHSSTLAVPARETITPRTRPTHDMLWRSLLPEGEVSLVLLLADTSQFAALVDDVLQVTSGEDTVLMILVILLDIEVDRAVALVGIAIVEDFLYQFLLLDDMACGMRLDARRQHIQRFHGIMVAVGVVLRNLHWLQLLQACLLLNLVIALISIVLQMAHVGDVSNVANLVAQVLEIAEEYIEGDGRTRMTEMRIAIHSWATNIHAHVRSVERSESLFRTSESVVDQ